MMSSVTVLCPGARRYVVKVTPNKKLLEILEEVCAKTQHKASQHILKHGRKTLDLSLAFRLSGLPNKAHLELVPGVGAKASSNIGVALQVPGGERLQKEFPSSDTLWSIIEHWKQQSSSLQSASGKPVCVYMQQEIAGEAALRSATLRSLGLTQGRVLVRLHFKGDEDEETSMADSGSSAAAVPTASPAPEEVGEVPTKSLAPSHSVDAPCTGASTESSTSTSTTASTTAKVATTTSHVQAHIAQPSLAVDQRSQSTSTASSSAGDGDDTLEATVTTTTASDDTVSASGAATECTAQAAAPCDDEPMDTSTEATVTASAVGTASATGSALGTPNFPSATSGAMASTASAASKATGSLSAKMASGRKDTAAAMERKQWPKGGGHRLGASSTADGQPPSKRPNTGYQTEGEATSRIVAELSDPCERHTVLFDLNMAAAVGSSYQGQDPTDGFFDVTADDLKLILKDLQSTSVTDTAKPLLTQEMRFKDDQRKMAAYAQGVIRIQFPDKLVLQGVFRPAEPVQAIIDFVRQQLDDPALDFYLYTTPPKKVLKPLWTLYEAKLMPAAKLFFGCSESRQCYIWQDLVRNVSDLTDVEKVTSSYLPAPRARTAECAVDSSSASVPATHTEPVKAEPAPKNALTEEEEQKKTKALPKWFSLGTK